MAKPINFVFASLISLSLSSCASKEDAVGEDPSKDIIINEIMASNRTGLIADNGKPLDWIELRNMGDSTVNLQGFLLSVEKNSHKGDNATKIANDSVDLNGGKTSSWQFPDVAISPGEFMIVFVGKEKNVKKSKSLIADVKLPKEGATVQLITPRGEVVSEVTYGESEPDYSYARGSDGTFKKTYWKSPGFDNTSKGYEEALIKMDKKRKSDLVIWELMSRADHSYQNWVELKNIGDSAINLSDYSLAKKFGKKDGWRLPEKNLGPGEIITITLAGKRRGRGGLNAPFKVGSAETLVLMKNGKMIDGMNARCTIKGGSIGRMVGKKGLFFFATPTQNQENGRNGKRFVADPPVFDKSTGLYPANENITIHLADGSRRVRYTLDGSEPNSSSPIMKDSLVLKRPTVVRAYAEGDSVTLRSRASAASYLIGAEHDIAVMNISVSNSDLYDYERGIYAQGPGYTREWPHFGANYWKMWTRDAHVEFIDNKEGAKGFSVDCGLSIFGGYSRLEEKKSFRLKFRGKYGDSKVCYDFFDTGEPIELEDLVVRSGSQDWNRCMVRDEFFTSLMQEHSPSLLTQLYRPVALYVNAEYFGLYYLREKIDKDFVARKLNVPDDSISIIFSNGNIEAGGNSHYKKIMDFAAQNDMTNAENFQYIRDNVDLVGLIDYKIGEIYSGNTDVGNIRYVRSTSKAGDRKWHFVFYDLDATWLGYKPGAEFYLAVGDATTGVSVQNVFINKLLKNNDFRKLFLERVAHHLTNTFSKENTSMKFDALVEHIGPEMVKNCERWPQLSYETWGRNIETFRKKFDDKPKKMLDDLRQFLSVTPEENKTYFSHLGY